jgi:hypothetical protein
MANENLGAAKKAKNDEFYTQYADIEKEMNAYLEYNPDVFRDKTILLPCDDPEWSNFTKYFAQNFETFGLKKLVSTSYAPNSKPREIPYQPALFEIEDERFDEVKTQANGKIFTLTRDVSGDKRIDVDDLEWSYLDGDGDFRSDEVTQLRDEADFIITNPPFSLFREYWDWVTNSGKSFLMIAGISSITHEAVFRKIQTNKAWLGTGMGRWISGFVVPDSYELFGTEARLEDGKRIVSTNSSLWLTNVDHGKRHQKLQLMSIKDNQRFSKHKEIRERGYSKYDNYDALEVPFADSIPSDYEGVMGVPITYLGKHNPEQFQIIGLTGNRTAPEDMKIHPFSRHDRPYLNGKRMFGRVLIRKASLGNGK